MFLHGESICLVQLLLLLDLHRVRSDTKKLVLHLPPDPEQEVTTSAPHHPHEAHEATGTHSSPSSLSARLGERERTSREESRGDSSPEPLAPHRDIEVLLHLQLLQTAQSLQSGDVLHLVVAEVQVAESRQQQVLGQLLENVPRQVPPLQGPEPGQQPDRQVLQLQPQLRQAGQVETSRQAKRLQLHHLYRSATLQQI